MNWFIDLHPQVYFEVTKNLNPVIRCSFVCLNNKSDTDFALIYRHVITARRQPRLFSTDLLLHYEFSMYQYPIRQCHMKIRNRCEAEVSGRLLLILVINYKLGEPGSSVSRVSGHGLDDRAMEVRSPAEAKGFSI
jgi:hypothetical protein